MKRAASTRKRSSSSSTNPRRANPTAKGAPRARRAIVDVVVGRGMAAHRGSLARDAEESLALLGVGDCELSIALVGDAEIHRLNRDYRGVDRPTDVLAFAQREGEGADLARDEGPSSASGVELLGDVVIALPTARRQAHARGHEIDAELRELLVHGILHLLGYDHERSPAEARRMFARQRAILGELSAPARRSRKRR